MTLIDNAREVLLKAWSVKLWSASSVFLFLDVASSVLPSFKGVIPDNVMTVLALVFGIGGLISRFIQQRALAAKEGKAP